MIIRFVGIDGLCGNELKQIFSTVKYYDFIKNVEIRKIPGINLHNTRGEVVNIYDVSIEVNSDRDDVSVHIYDDVIHIVDCGCRHEVIINIDRSAYERLEIV